MTICVSVLHREIAWKIAISVSKQVIRLTPPVRSAQQLQQSIRLWASQKPDHKLTYGRNMQHPKKKGPKEITWNNIFNCLHSNIIKARTTGMHMLILTSLFLEIQTHSGGHETAQSWIVTACVSSLFRGVAWKIATRHWCMEDCNKHFSPLLASKKQEHNARIYIFSHRFVFMC